MFEYANNGTLFLGGLTFFLLLLIAMYLTGKAQIEGKTPGAGVWAATGVMLIVLYTIIDEGVTSKQRALASYKQYEKQGDIICSVRGKNYIVSKPRGWVRYHDGFTKNDILINVRECRAEE